MCLCVSVCEFIFITFTFCVSNQRRSSVAPFEPCILTNSPSQQLIDGAVGCLETIESPFYFEDSGMASLYGQGKTCRFGNVGMDTLCNWLRCSHVTILKIKTTQTCVYHACVCEPQPGVISTWITNYRRC